MIINTKKLKILFYKKKKELNIFYDNVAKLILEITLNRYGHFSCKEILNNSIYGCCCRGPPFNLNLKIQIEWRFFL